MLSPPANRGLSNAFETDAGESGSEGVSAMDFNSMFDDLRREREQIDEIISLPARPARCQSDPAMNISNIPKNPSVELMPDSYDARRALNRLLAASVEPQEMLHFEFRLDPPQVKPIAETKEPTIDVDEMLLQLRLERRLLEMAIAYLERLRQLRRPRRTKSAGAAIRIPRPLADAIGRKLRNR
jgi:hypothetical protein